MRHLYAYFLLIMSISLIAAGGVTKEAATSARGEVDKTIVTPREPAPPLTGVATLYIASESHPEGEPVKPGQLQTTLQHGGGWLAVVVYEQGYGTNEHAKLNTEDGKLLWKQGVEKGIVQNWLLCYLFKPFDEGGHFEFTATGINGGGTHTTSIQILRAP